MFRTSVAILVLLFGAAQAGEIGNRVWADSDENGIQDSGEKGVADVGVQLLGCKGPVLGATLTDRNGRFMFEGLAEGVYRLKFTALGGSYFTRPDSGSREAKDSDADATGLTRCVAVAAAVSNRSTDAGLVFRPRLIEFPVVGRVRMGDSQPFWEEQVWIDQGELDLSTYAALELKVAGVWHRAPSNVLMNGRAYALPPTEPLTDLALPARGKTVISIPLGALQSGDNTIGLEAGEIDNPTNRYDDFWVEDVVLLLSR